MDENEILDETAVPSAIYFSKPSLVSRIKSMLIDSMVIIILMIIASKALTLFNIESGIIRGIVFVMILLYEPIFTSLNRTFGQKIMGLRVRNFSEYKSSANSENINIGWSLIRYFFKAILGWISLLTIHSNSYGKAIHDSLANSIMTIEK